MMEKTSMRPRLAGACLLGVLAAVFGPAAAEAQPIVYVGSAGSNSVTPVDGSSMTIKGSPIAVGAQPTSLAVTPDGATVIAGVLAKKDGERVVVIDTARNARSRFWKPFGLPVGVVVEPQIRSAGRRLAHVLVRDGAFGTGISVFNLKRMVWIHYIRGRRDAKLLAVAPDGSRLYVPGTDHRTGRAFLSEFNFFFGSGQSHTGLRNDIAIAGGAIGGFGITPDSRFVVVVTQDPSGALINTVDRASRNRVATQGLGGGIVADDLAIGRGPRGIFGLLTTDQELVELSASGTPAAVRPNSAVFPATFVPNKVAITPDGTAAFVTDASGPLVARLDVARGGAARPVKLPGGTAPTALVMSPDGKFLFVGQGDSTGGVVSRIDTTTSDVKSVAVPGQPVVLAVSPGAAANIGEQPCNDNLDLCGTQCVNLDSDAANCGACGRVCPAGNVCTARSCECPRERQICGGQCSDPSTDSANCGGCGNICSPDKVCISGKCICPPGQEICNGQCVDKESDRRNCGKCGNVCASGNICSKGTCGCAPGNVVCNGACTNVEADRNNCGRCSQACIAGDICASGRCVCPQGRKVCSDQCVDLEINLRNCGTCGRACLAGEVCVSGRCTCPAGHKICRDQCVDTATDPANCGICAHVCAAGQKCVAGRCG